MQDNVWRLEPIPAAPGRGAGTSWMSLQITAALTFTDSQFRVEPRSVSKAPTALPQGPKTNDNVLILHLFPLSRSPVRNSQSSRNDDDDEKVL